MRKARFERKCLELVEYEDKCFGEVKSLIAPLNDELNKRGYEIIFRRFWLNHAENDGRLEDHRIAFNRGYKCLFCVQFQIKGADPDDENGIGFQIMQNPTGYGITIINVHTFAKWKLKFLHKKTQQCFAEVMQSGLKETAEKYNK